MTSPSPYRTTPVFDENTLPATIRSVHATKEGVWGVLRVFEGRVHLVFHEPARTLEVTPDAPGPIPPQAEHHVETCGPMRMQVEFYHEPPVALGDA